MTDLLIGIQYRIPVQTCDFSDEIVKHDVVTDYSRDMNMQFDFSTVSHWEGRKYVPAGLSFLLQTTLLQFNSSLFCIVF